MKFILQENKEEFEFKSDKKNFDIRFNRIAFIFFIFFLISIIYCIHLTHLGSRDLNSNISKNYGSFKKIQRANILDRNNHFLAKTVNSIDIGINPVEPIDKKKLLLNLKYIFPNKDFVKIQNQLKNKKFFYLEKKISEENYEKVMKLGDKSIQPEEKLTRIYPEKNLFSHILGQIDNDNNGVSGLEK